MVNPLQFNTVLFSMSKIFKIDSHQFLSDGWSTKQRSEALENLEGNNVVFIPGLTIGIREEEKVLFSLDKALTDGVQKNITLDPFLKKTSGLAKESPYRSAVNGLMERYRDETANWLVRLLGEPGRKYQPQRTTFRPVEISNRATLGKVGSDKQFRFDDTLLHADAFKRRPMVKRRILRVFNNVNPFGAPRLWKVGGDFTEYAKRYVNKIRQPYPGEFAILNMLRLTHWKRSHYDHIMLNLHDMGKQDRDFQKNSPQQQFAFPPNSVWMCFTDGVLHAALAGRYALEQTFEINIDDMVHPEKSPQRLLEGLTGKSLC